MTFLNCSLIFILFANDVKLYLKVVSPVDEDELQNTFLLLFRGMRIGSCLSVYR